MLSVLILWNMNMKQQHRKLFDKQKFYIQSEYIYQFIVYECLFISAVLHFKHF